MKREKAIYSVTIWGAVVNILLVAFKFAAGILGSSAAMIADAVHSLSDLISDAIVLVFAKISSKPADKLHNYGHGKYETLATLILGCILLLVSGGILYDGIEEIDAFFDGEPPVIPGWIAFGAALLSILLKELIFRITLRVGKRIHSEMVIANAWHHRSDSLSSVGTAIGIGAAVLLGGKWAIADAFAAVVVSLFIAIAAVQILNSAINQLTDRSLNEEELALIRRLVSMDNELSDLHNLRTRRVGNMASIEMHIRMPGEISLSEAHRHSTLLEERIRGEFGKETLINIHIEPVKNFS